MISFILILLYRNLTDGGVAVLFKSQDEGYCKKQMNEYKHVGSGSGVMENAPHILDCDHRNPTRLPRNAGEFFHPPRTVSPEIPDPVF